MDTEVQIKTYKTTQYFRLVSVLFADIYIYIFTQPFDYEQDVTKVNL